MKRDDPQQPWSTSDQLSFLRDSGETGNLILQHDWSRSPVGEIAQWPSALRTTLANILRSGFPMFLFWGDDLTCFYNDAFRPSLGAEGKHPAIGKSAPEVWPEIWDFIGPLIQEVLTKGRPISFRDQLVPFYRNGRIEEIYWTFSYSPAYDEQQRIQGVLVTCMETTDTVAAQRMIEAAVAQRTQELENSHQLLKDANKYLQNIINLCKEPIQVLEPVVEKGEIVDFRFKLANTAYSAYTKTTPDELIGRRVGDFFPAYFQTTSFTKTIQTFKTGIPETWEIHYDVDGLDLYNEMTATKVDNEVVLLFIDFTKLKHLELNLVDNIEELKRSNQYLEEFTNAASHDLKEPVRKILTFTSRLKSQLMGHLAEKQIQAFSKIEKAAERMAQLIDDLLLYSQVSQQPMQQGPVDLNGILQQVMEDLELHIAERNAVVSISELKHIQGYARQLQQMFQNLVSNALKYSKSDTPPAIFISGEEQQLEGTRYYVVEVRDNGIGFDQAQEDNIFKMFFRLHDRQHYSGTGIGLSIVKKVIENHQALIKVNSVPGEGSSFRIYFPLGTTAV
jgi:signal transduction histidine kinase